MTETNRKQQDRYRAALPNLIYTNCLEWDFYRKGERVASVTIADYLMVFQTLPASVWTARKFASRVHSTETAVHYLAAHIGNDYGRQSVIDSGCTCKHVACRCRLKNGPDEQFNAFREHLIHDISQEEFADIYAETIAYGLFAARLHDTTPESFTRQEALELLPKSNPFLRSLFGYVAGHDLDDRIAWIIDDLADAFQASDVAKLMEGFGTLTGKQDPFLHFYETFLTAYNPETQGSRRVVYAGSSC